MRHGDRGERRGDLARRGEGWTERRKGVNGVSRLPWSAVTNPHQSYEQKNIYSSDNEVVAIFHLKAFCVGAFYPNTPGHRLNKYCNP